MSRQFRQSDDAQMRIPQEYGRHKEHNELMHELLSGLNDAQIQAVTHGEGPALVLAGPGSGKTTVIVKRILYLIQIQKIPPEEILVVTFTKEAALSMQRRFMSQSQASSGQFVVQPVNFGTFHSIFYHILLKSHYPAASKVLTQTQKREIMQEILKKRAIQKSRHYEYESLRAQTDDFLAAIGFYKNTQDMDKTYRLLPTDGQEDFKEILGTYREKCQRIGGLDFDDMVYECRELLMRDRAALEYWQNRFSYILVDEFQDINPIQYEVLKLLGRSHRNLFVVGDEDQAIYGFRGSSPECVRRFAREYQARQILLNANYRSTAEIVSAAERVIAENKSRFLQNKGSYAAGENAKLQESIRLIPFETRGQELTYLKERLREFYHSAARSVSAMGEPIRYGTKAKEKETPEASCGVLFRTNSAMQGLAVLLAKENIPFVMKEQSGNIYEHFIVKDIMAYLKLASGERSRAMFLRIMNKPLRYISRECAGEEEQLNLAGLSGQNEKANQELGKLRQQLERMRTMPLLLAVQYICKAIGYEMYLKQQREAREHMEEWLEILELCKEDAKNYGSVADWEQAQKNFEKQLRLTAKENTRRKPTEEPSSAQQEEPVISLMTVHASKGLEFDRVYIPDCNEKTYPHGNMPDREVVEEERRIFYVGMTRAKKNLELLTVTGTKESPRLLSRFLNPIIRQLTHQTRNCPDTRQKRP